MFRTTLQSIISLIFRGENWESERIILLQVIQSTNRNLSDSFYPPFLQLLQTFVLFCFQFVFKSPWWLSRKKSACSAGDRNLIPEWGRSSGEGNGNPLQYSYLENSMDRGAWLQAMGSQELDDWVTKQQILILGHVLPDPFQTEAIRSGAWIQFYINVLKFTNISGIWENEYINRVKIVCR